MRSPKDTRWTCHSCTACCRGFQIGPVEEEVIENLQQTQVPSWWKPAADTEWFEQRGEPGKESNYYFRSVDGHCIFLRDDGLCAIHARYGEEKKPGFCREFPFHIVEEGQGAVGVIRAECEGWHRSFKNGPPIEDKLDGVKALPRVVPHRRFDGPTVRLYPRADISLAHWEHLESEFMGCLEERPRGIEGDLIELRNIICTLTGQEAPEGDQAAYLALASSLLQPLAAALNRVLNQAHEDPHQVAFTQQSLQRIQATIEHLNREPLPPSKDQEPEYFNQVLQNWMLGKRFLEVGPLSGGLGSFALGTIVARCAAADSTALEGVATHYAGWLRFTGIPFVQQTLSSSLPALHQLFLRARVSP